MLPFRGVGDYEIYPICSSETTNHYYVFKLVDESKLRTPRTKYYLVNSKMYALRSGILHGSSLMQMDQDIAFGFNPLDFNEAELHRELWSITRLALRNWLKKSAIVNEAVD